MEFPDLCFRFTCHLLGKHHCWCASIFWGHILFEYCKPNRLVITCGLSQFVIFVLCWRRNQAAMFGILNFYHVCFSHSEYLCYWANYGNHFTTGRDFPWWFRIREPSRIAIFSGVGIIVVSKVVSTHLWNTPLNLYQPAIKGFLS